MRGFTIYVPNPTNSNIQAFCDNVKRQYIDGYTQKRNLKIHFFDNKAFTPDVSSRYYFPETSDQYLVADYFYNPFNGKTELAFHKEVP